MRTFILALIFLTTSANATDNENTYQILGIGTFSCASYVKDMKNTNMLLLYTTWANGYLTHYNVVMPNAQDITVGVDHTAREQWLYKYCKNNVLDNFDTAVKALIKELNRRNK